MQWFGMHGAAYGNWAVTKATPAVLRGVLDDRIHG